MKTNDIKKGMRFRLRNGWEGEMADNMKGNTRLATVYGYYTEIGSVYAHEIIAAKVGDDWEKIEYTPAQVKLAKTIGAMGF